jgi:flagellar biogenesis protein FliO
MKTLILKLTMLLAVSAAFTPLAFSQSAPGTADNLPNSNSNSEAMAADEKLPFMQQEESRDPGSVSTGGIIFKTLGAMLIVIGIIFFGAWGLKKFGFGGLRPGANADAPELSIVSSVTVGNGRTISSIKFGNRILLVGSTPQSFTLLADGADEEPFAPASPRSVAELLAAEDSFEDELARADAGLISLFQGGRA